MAPSGDPAVVAVFDRVGKPLAGLGRYGNGPGEFISIGWLVPGLGDSLVVIDRATRRLSFFSPQLKYVRSIGVAGVQVFGAAVLRDGTILLQGVSGRKEAAGQVLHLVSPSGALVSSFGSRFGALDPRRSLTDQRREIAAGAQGSIWSARPNRFEIEEWSRDGRLLRTLTRSPGWFHPWEPTAQDDKSGRVYLRTGITALRTDSDGLLWVFLAEPKPGAVAPKLPTRDGSGESGPPLGYREIYRLHRTVIEVLDTRTLTLVAATVLEDFLFTGTPGDFLYRLRDTAEGAESIEILKLQLRRESVRQP